MDKQINTVWSSRDYDKFRFIEGNREINSTKLAHLKQSIENRFLEKPIDVNESFEIIDGQHRFMILRELKMPIIFIIHKGWGLPEVPILNTNQNNWNPADFVKSYIQLGKSEYKIYQEFQDRWGFPSPANLFLLTGANVIGGLQARKFRDGEFKATSITFGNEAGMMITDFKELYSGYKRTKFIMAMSQLFRMKDYNHKHMMKKVELLSGRLLHRPTIDEYVKQMKEIYNYKHSGGFVKL